MALPHSSYVTGHQAATDPDESKPGPDTLVHQYAVMAHAYERRPIDVVLRGLDF